MAAFASANTTFAVLQNVDGKPLSFSFANTVFPETCPNHRSTAERQLLLTLLNAEEGKGGVTRAQWDEYLRVVQAALDEGRLVEGELDTLLGEGGRQAFRDLALTARDHVPTLHDVLERAVASQVDALSRRVATLEREHAITEDGADLKVAVSELAARVQSMETRARRRRRVVAVIARATVGVGAAASFEAALIAGHLHRADDLAASVAALVAVEVAAVSLLRVTGWVAALIDTVGVACLCLASDVTGCRLMHATRTDEVVAVSITIGVVSLLATVYMLSRELRRTASACT